MGFWRDFAETVGLALPSEPLDQLGRTGIRCLDSEIDRAVRDDIRRAELEKKLSKKEQR